MERDLTRYPKDDNGDVLWHFASQGIQLPDEAEVRYAILFPKEEDALKFGVFLLRHSYWVKVNDELEDQPGYEAEVLVGINLEITHKDITEAEEWLAEQFAPLNGKNDGWEIKVSPQGKPKMTFTPLE